MVEIKPSFDFFLFLDSNISSVLKISLSLALPETKYSHWLGSERLNCSKSTFEIADSVWESVPQSIAIGALFEFLGPCNEEKGVDFPCIQRTESIAIIIL